MYNFQYLTENNYVQKNDNTVILAKYAPLSKCQLSVHAVTKFTQKITTFPFQCWYILEHPSTPALCDLFLPSCILSDSDK